MIRLIEATPGSGKTCIVIEWLLSEVDKGFYGNYYSNIADLKVAGVRALPDDWRDINPDKSEDVPPQLVIIDEAQYLEPFMKENRSAKNEIGKALSTHRHYGIDIWFITQSCNLLNDYVLSNVGEHVYLYRPRKKKTVKVYWWSFVQKTKSSAAFKSADDVQSWRLNPNIFKYYKSTANVTDGKARVSQKMLGVFFTFSLVAALIVFMVFRGYGAYKQTKINEKQITGTTEQALNANQEPSTTEDTQVVQQESLEALEAQRVAMVFGSSSSCVAKNSKGFVIQMSYAECMRYSDDPRLLGSSYLPTTTTFDNFGIDATPVDASS